MKPRRLLMPMLFTVALTPLATLAQPPESGTPEAGPGRARMFLVLRIADALKLSEPDALKVSTVIRQADDRRQALITQRQALEEKLRAALARKPVDTTELTPLIASGYDLDQKLAMIPEDSFRDLQNALTVEQQARLLLFRRELQGEIRSAIRGRRLGGGRRPRQGHAGAPTD